MTTKIKDYETWSPWQLLGRLSESADCISRSIPTWGRPVDRNLVMQLCEEHVILTMALSASVNENLGKWSG